MLSYLDTLFGIQYQLHIDEFNLWQDVLFHRVRVERNAQCRAPRQHYIYISKTQAHRVERRKAQKNRPKGSEWKSIL